ncbi:MAG: hypothetical protein C5B50_06850 [Verrucomicrobia bacterium]|nr:MAG: hypothetical protein C5B50_06850 [Verrucomicrobiota bacterium]
MRRSTAEEYIEWAIGMLVKGYDSPNLKMLAALSANTTLSEAEPHFSRALAELGIPELNEPEALTTCASRIADQILEAQLAPEAAACLRTFDVEAALWAALRSALGRRYETVRANPRRAEGIASILYQVQNVLPLLPADLGSLANFNHSFELAADTILDIETVRKNFIAELGKVANPSPSACSNCSIQTFHIETGAGM